MIPIFKIDGKTYNIGVISLKRNGAVLDTDKSGRLKSGNMSRDIIGTYYNYDVVFGTNRLSATEYDELYQTLTAPVEYHNVYFPYGQASLAFKAYVSNANDELLKVTGGVKKWGNLTVSFVAKAPERTP